MKSLGFVEVSGTVAAIDALDIMLKSSSVKLVTWERKLGGRLVTVIIEGSVSDVTEAIENAKQKCIGRVRASNVIANPHEETIRLVNLSASRINGKKDPVKESAPKAEETVLNADEQKTPEIGKAQSEKPTQTRKTKKQNK